MKVGYICRSLFFDDDSSYVYFNESEYLEHFEEPITNIFCKEKDMKILIYPNSMLSVLTEPVLSFNEHLIDVLEGMKTAMLNAKGLGLSANQVGIDKQILIIRDAKGTIHEFINPQIISTDGSVIMNEGCLSAPGIFLTITRPESLQIKFQDRTGESKQVVAEGIEARTILHEMEHLRGDFYFNRVNRVQRKAAEKMLKKSLR